MGRIKTTYVKRKTREVLKAYPDAFTTDFSENKIRIGKHAQFMSKKMRNVITGYITRLKKRETKV